MVIRGALQEVDCSTGSAMRHRPTPESLSSINGNVWPDQSSQWRVGREPAGENHGLSRRPRPNVELAAYCDHAHDCTLPANVLMPPTSPAVTECTSKLQEEFAVVL